MVYTGNSVVDYLTSVGHPTDFSSRAALATQNGISNYTGSSVQNLQLLNTLRSTPPVVTQPQVDATAAPVAQKFTTAETYKQITGKDMPAGADQPQANSANANPTNPVQTQTTDPNAPGYTDPEHQAAAAQLNPNGDANAVNVPPGWDATTYANFKKSNPGLEPTPEDTARMQSNPTGITAVTRDANDNFFVTENGVQRQLSSADPGSEFQKLGINADFVPKGQTVALSQAQSGKTMSGNPSIQDTFSNLQNAYGITQGANEFSTNPAQALKDLVTQVMAATGLPDVKSELESQAKEIEDMNNKRDAEIAEVNDNPWLAEGVRQKNVEKIQTKYENKTANMTARFKLLQSTYDDARQQAQFAATTALSLYNNQQALDEKKLEFQMTQAENSLEAQNKLQPGAVGEYQYYAQQELDSGRKPLSFNEYQNMDANRKAKVAGGGNITDGMTIQQRAAFNSIIDKQNRSPLILASDRTPILKAAVEAIKKDPGNAALQLNLSYAYIQALDTYQSSVREGELGNLNSIDSKIGGLQNSVQQIQKGQIVRPEIATQIANAADSIIQTISAAAKQKAASFRSQAVVNGIGDQYDQYQSGYVPSYSAPIIPTGGTALGTTPSGVNFLVTRGAFSTPSSSGTTSSGVKYTIQ